MQRLGSHCVSVAGEVGNAGVQLITQRIRSNSAVVSEITLRRFRYPYEKYQVPNILDMKGALN